MAIPYKIGVAIAMSSNHNAILSALSSGLLGVDAKVSQLQGGFSRLKTIIGGALALGAGMALLGVMEKLVDKTKDYQDELIRLKALGGDMLPAVTSGAVSAKAFDIAKRVPMNVTDLVKIPGMGYSILGQEDSMTMWEDLAKFQTVMQFQEHKSPEAASGELSKFLRAGELGGRLTDPKTHKVAVEELKRFMDLSQKVMAATHGMVSPSTLLGMSQQAGFSMRHMSDDGFMNMAIVAQAMGGQKAGTALLSTYQQMGGGKMTRQAAQNMQDMGMLNENEWTTDHGKVIVSADAQRRLGKLVSENPMNLVNEMLKNLEKRGITDPVEQNRLVMGALSRQTGQRFVTEQMMNKGQIDAERGRMKQGMGQGDMFDTIMNESISKNQEAFHSAWNNLLIAIAGPNSANVIVFLKKLTDGLNWMTDTVRKMDPETITSIAKALGGLGFALSAGGAAAILAALGPTGWLIAGLGALGVALMDPRFRQWLASNSISDALIAWVNESYERMKPWLASHSISDALIGWISSVYDSIQPWLQSHSIANMIVGWLQNTIDGIMATLGIKGTPGEGDAFGKALKDQGYQNQSYEGRPERRGPLLIPSSFDPGQKTMTAQPIQISMNIDGRSLGQAVSEQLMYLATFSGSAPSANGRSFPTGGDHNYSST